MPTIAPDRPAGRIVLAATVIPLALTAVAAWLLWSWRGDLPDPVARHWGSDGADGFSSLTTIVIMTVVIGVVLTGTGAVLAIVSNNRWTARIAIGTAAATTALTVAILVVSVAGQRGLADAAEATLHGGWALAAVAVGMLVGVACAALVPTWATAVPDDEGTDVDAAPLGPAEQVAWSRSVGLSTPGVVIVVVSALVVAVIAVVTAQGWLTLIPVAIVAMFLTMATARVAVDRRGVTVRGPLPWPRFHTPLDSIARADVVQVNAIRDFGGFGARLSVMGPHRGSRGLVLRSGEALRLTRGDGGRELVVVDDAATAAALVNALVQRSR